jgi:hypothetical protein
MSANFLAASFAAVSALEIDWDKSLDFIWKLAIFHINLSYFFLRKIMRFLRTLCVLKEILLYNRKNIPNFVTVSFLKLLNST